MATNEEYLGILNFIRDNIHSGGSVDYFHESNSPRYSPISIHSLPSYNSLNDLTKFALNSDLVYHPRRHIYEENFYRGPSNDICHAKFYTFIEGLDRPALAAVITIDGKLFISRFLAGFFVTDQNEQVKSVFSRVTVMYDQIHRKFVDNWESTNLDFEDMKISCLSSIHSMISQSGVYRVNIREIMSRVNKVFDDVVIDGNSNNLTQVSGKVIQSNVIYRTTIAKLIAKADAIAASSKKEGFRVGFHLMSALMSSGYVYNETHNAFIKPVNFVPKICVVNHKWFTIPDEHLKYSVTDMVFYISKNEQAMENNIVTLNIFGSHPNTASGDGKVCLGNENERKIRDYLVDGATIEQYMQFLIDVETTLHVINYGSSYQGIDPKIVPDLIPYVGKDGSIDVPIVKKDLSHYFEEI